MLFTHGWFFVFFAVVFCVYWKLQDRQPQKRWLLACSYFFYACFDWRFLSLLMISTTVDYFVARWMQRTDVSKERRRWLIVSVVVNLGILAVFKYFNFFVDSAIDLAAAVGTELPERTARLVVPVGISFFTFQTLSYTIDVYRGNLRASDSFINVAVFVAFFPQLVAGPIVRASDFLPQLPSRKPWDKIAVRTALLLFLSGYIKKACISDNIAPLIDPVFRYPHLFSTSAVWTAVFGYAAQIYCDFSGYSEMAIAVAALLGFQLPRNFDFPYFATNIADFWRRWHISLSTWLRDYLYITLGGNRGSTVRTYRNLLLTMVLGGIWHGAGWNFLIWGTIHGVVLVGYRWFRERTSGRTSKLLGWSVTMFLVLLAWVFFRCETTPRAMKMLQAMAGHPSGTYRVTSVLTSALTVLVLVHAINYFCSRRFGTPRVNPFSSVNGPTFYLLLGLAAGLAISFARREPSGFIYFRF